jgi:hypothetical protein
MKAYWGGGYSSTHSLTSELDGGETCANSEAIFWRVSTYPWEIIIIIIIIIIDLREIGWERVAWIHLAQDRYLWRALVKGYWTLGFHKRREFLDYLSEYQLLELIPAYPKASSCTGKTTGTNADMHARSELDSNSPYRVAWLHDRCDCPPPSSTRRLRCYILLFTGPPLPSL